jgi:GAF domain-containing protein
MGDNSPSSFSSSRTGRQVLERIALQMASSLDLQLVLTTITQGLVEELDAAFARIWLLGPGDLCAECYKAADRRAAQVSDHSSESRGPCLVWMFLLPHRGIPRRHSGI